MLNKPLIIDQLRWFVLLIITLYPLTLLSMDVISGLCMLLLLIISIYFIFRNLKNIQISKIDKQVFFAFLFFFSIAFIASLMADFSDGQNKLIKLMLIPLSLPIYILLRHIKNFETLFWYVTVIGALVACGVAFYDVFVLNQARALGATHPIIFGNIALSLGAMSLTGYQWFKQRGGYLYLLPILAFVAGLIASALSLSRGGWVALPAILLIMLFYFKASFKTVILMTVIFMVSIMAVYSVPQTGISQRIDKTISNIQMYADSDIKSSLRRTSIGTRFEMWQASIEIFNQHPLIGVGWGHYKEEAQKQVDAGLRNPSAAAAGHPHNEYFSVLVASGMVGLIALMALFLIPIKLFIKGIKSNLSTDKSLYYAGIMHVVLTMHFTLSEAVLERSRSVIFFALYLVIILALAHSKTDQTNTS